MKNDHELIRKFQNGSNSAFDELVKRHLTNVYGFFIRFTGNRWEAEDLAQDVFIKLYKSLKKFRFEADFSTYLFRVNTNMANSYLRRNRWKHLLHLEQAPERGEPDLELEKEWSRTDLWNGVAKLPKQQRLVVMMRIAQEMPYKDIAKILDISEGSAKVNYHYGLNKLKEILGEN